MKKTSLLDLYKLLGRDDEKGEKKAFDWWGSLTGVGRSFVVVRLGWARLAVGLQLVEELEKIRDRQGELFERLEKLNRAQVRLLRELLDSVAPEEPEAAEPEHSGPMQELVPRRREEEEDTAEVPSAAGSAQ